MAKKKRRKKRTTRPAAPPEGRSAERAEATRPASHRAERKEQARRERERRIKQARRRQRLRRATRWGMVLGVGAGVAALIMVATGQSGELQAAAAAAARRIGCGQVQTPADEGTEHLQPGAPPPEYGTVPATSGPHSSSPLPPEPKVYDQPVPEVSAVHNLEHGYVLVQYRNEGEGALAPPVVDTLTDLVEGDSEVIMAPYPNLPDGTSLALTAWTRLLECDVQGSPADVRLVVEGFIDEFKNSTAPENAAT
jgi:hypothetical protein